MPRPPIRLAPGAPLTFDAIRAELGIEVAFPAGALAEAERAATAPDARGHTDRRDVPFVTVDPAGSRDLDQAVAIERRGSGYTVRYAIADVAAFVRPGGLLDAETRRRGVTIYLPDRRAPLHPPVLGEGAASLLPGRDRLALVWHLSLDAAGALTAVHVERAVVRSRRRYAYDEAQALLDAGDADEGLVLLAEVGTLRQQQEVARGGVDLPLPEQVVVPDGDRWDLRYRAPVALERQNAQISLLAGIAAASLMLDGRVGVLRTLPPPEPGTVDALRRRARALGVPWPDGVDYPAFIRTLDPAVADHAALLTQAARLLRGADYVAFDGALPDAPGHAAVAAPYAHVTAPLRRLADRFANEVVLALAADRPVPAWTAAALPSLPELMRAARRREGAADRMAVDLVEAAVLATRVGDVLDGVVTDLDDRGARVQLRHPAVIAPVRGNGLRLGDEVRVRVVAADATAGTVVLSPA